MSDFTSEFWNIFVIVGTVGSIAYCAWLLIVTSRARVKAGPAPGAEPSVKTTGHVWDGDLAEYNNPLPRWWMWLFWITIVYSVGYLVVYPGLGRFPGLSGWTSADAHAKESAAAYAKVKPLYEKYLATDLKEVAADPQARAMGERLFLNECAQCHGSDAGGSRGFPNLRDNDWLYGGAPETIRESITNGRMGVMPALAAGLGTDGTKDVVAYVRSLSGLANDGLRAKIGRPLFEQNCAACHGMDGKGNQAVGAPNLTDAIWLYGSSEATMTEGIVKGRNVNATQGTTTMPAHKDTLGAGKVQILAAYVWGLSNRPAGK
jgi:cytochrome c oxidase cbb3-type subunit 3